MHNDSTRPRFVATEKEWDMNYEKFTSDAFVLWADTQNVITSAAYPKGDPNSDWGEIETALTILHKVPDDVEGFHNTLDQCETILHDCIRRMQVLSDPMNCKESTLRHIEMDSPRLFRDGPYTNNYWGATARLRLKFASAIPVYNPSKWTTELN
jgi:hypothetical protein